MNHERILSYAMSHKLSEQDLSSISAAGTTVVTGVATIGPHGESDMSADVQTDFQ